MYVCVYTQTHTFVIKQGHITTKSLEEITSGFIFFQFYEQTEFFFF